MPLAGDAGHGYEIAMRQIGSIPDLRDAGRFGDYLLTLGIGNSVEESPSSGEWAVWVEHDDDLDRAAGELSAFVANPADPRYNGATRQAKTIRAEQERAAERRRKNFTDVRTRWSQPQQWNVPLTLSLIGISVVVAIITHLDFGVRSEAADPLRITEIQRVTVGDRVGVLVAPLKKSIVADHQVWRVITPIFLHGGILHILFNMLWLRDFGGMIETRKGTLFFALLVLAIAILSNLAQYALDHNPFFGGMSGVVFGLFGYVWVRGRIDPAGGIGISRENSILMFVWLVLCFTGIVGAIANGAHVVGLLVGLAFGYIPHTVRKLLR
jgi:GlpG protein